MIMHPTHKRMRIRIAACFAFIALLAAPLPLAAADTATANRDAIAEFNRKIKDYQSMEHALPADKLKPTADVAALEQQRVALRSALKAARPNAKQGDVFTPAASAEFRRLLAKTMSGPDGAKIRASLAHAEPGAPTEFIVNGMYPQTAGKPMQSVPATLLANLPILPKGLEYRVAGGQLAIRDTDANIIVDYLPNALP